MEDFMDLSKPLVRNIDISGNIRMSINPTDTYPSQVKPRANDGTEYVKEVVSRELELMTKNFQERIKMNKAFLENIEDNGPFDELESLQLEYNNKYNYTDLKDDLPISKYHKEIIDQLNQHPIIILTGSTGCGKTTQVPQYILNDCYKQKKNCNIVITQPRKIAAITVAQRVAFERKCQVGTLVGYQVGLQRKIDTSNSETRLLFCTTGVLLQNLINSKDLNRYTHIILDEVHERDIEMDFLLLVVRRLWSTKLTTTKIILMSATMNADHFSQYFKMPIDGAFKPAPIIYMGTERTYSITEFYLENLKHLRYADSIIDYLEPGISKGMYQLALKVITLCLRRIDNKRISSILVFLPGLYEIEYFDRVLTSDLSPEIVKKCKICVLHSSLSTEDQRVAFAPSSVPKIILSTNISESSVTFKNVDYVIDFCLSKNLVAGNGSTIASLVLEWSSKINCEQRAGRTGRLYDGKVYRLVHKSFYNTIDVYGVPEMLRIPIETVVLKSKLLDMGSPLNILGLALDPPSKRLILDSILLLKELGGLYALNDQSKFNLEDGELSYIGRIMAVLPIDVRLSRFIVLGYTFSVLDDIIIIAAGLNIKSIFKYNFKRQIHSYDKKMSWANGSSSDCIAILNAYKMWLSRSEQGGFSSRSAEEVWCQRFDLEMKNLYEMKELIKEISIRLTHLRMVKLHGALQVYWTNEERPFIIKLCIAGAFLPYYFLQTNCSDEREVYKSICNLDPYHTIYFTKMNRDFPGKIYENQIKDYLISNGICNSRTNMKVTFDYVSSSKIYITFRNSKSLIDTKANGLALENVRDNNPPAVVSGKILPEIYKAVNLRFSQHRLILKVMNFENSVKYAISKGLGQMINGRFEYHKEPDKEKSIIPTVLTKTLNGIVTHIEHCNKFYFRPIGPVYDNQYKTLQKDIKRVNKMSISDIDCNQICTGMYVLVKDGVNIFRGKILEYKNIGKYLIEFLDIGIEKSIMEKDIFYIDRDDQKLFKLPCRVFECTLTNIQPSFKRCPNAKWTKEAIQEFKDIIDDQLLTAIIYSVVNLKVSVELLTCDKLNINEMLIKTEYAMTCEESYPSKMDHDYRMQQQLHAYGYDDDYNKINNIIDNEYSACSFANEIYEQNIEPPPLHECHNEIELFGPWSPLETKLQSLASGNKSTYVTIEKNSVNAIILDSGLQEFYDRLYVASDLTKNAKGSGITARCTTMMPNIPGLVGLFALIFCPKMKLRRNSDKTRFVSLLTGLGYDENREAPYYPEHDLIIPINFDLSIDDLEMINQLRYSMSYLLLTGPTEIYPTHADDLKSKAQNKIKEMVHRIFDKNRNFHGQVYIDKDSEWITGDESDYCEENNFFINRGIFAMHTFPNLVRQSKQQIIQMKNHIEQLKLNTELEYGDQSHISKYCKLCNRHFETINDLRIHFLSKMHINLENQLN